MRNPLPVGDPACWDGYEGGGEVVYRVESQSYGCGRFDAPVGAEQFGGSQDEKRGGHVAGFERPDRQPDAAQAAFEERLDTYPELNPFRGCGSSDVTDGVDDRPSGHQPENNGYEDRPTDSNGGDQGEGQQRTANRSKVVHHPFEPIGPAIGADPGHVG
jgi:hypothetical protein